MTHAQTISAAAELIDKLGGRACVLHQGPGTKRRNGYAGLWGTPGIPDMYVQLPRRDGVFFAPATFWFEVKVGRDRLRPDQQEFIRREEASSGLPVLVGGIEVLEEYLGVGAHVRTGCSDTLIALRDMSLRGVLFNAKMGRERV